jgi:hypothetical protein
VHASRDRRVFIERFMGAAVPDRATNGLDQSFILLIRNLREERSFKSANKEIL